MDYEKDMEGADKEPFLVGTNSVSRNNGKNVRDLHLLSISFLFVFLAYSGIQNLESSLNSDGNLGPVSLGVLYLSLTIFSIGAPFPVKWLGSKNGILLGLSGYWVFAFANLFPNWYTMIPASLFLGFTAALLWVAEGTYITRAAKMHASQTKASEESAIGDFNGVFWGYFASNQVIGNLLSLIILHYGKSADATSTGSSSTSWPLLLTYLACMSVGTCLACFLRPQAAVSTQSHTPENEPTLQGLSATFRILWNTKMLLLLPLLIYSGLQQAFIWGDYTEYIVSPVLGVSLIGGVMAAFGAADAAYALLAGRLSGGVSSVSNLIYIGAAAQLLILVWLYLKRSYESDVVGYGSLFVQAVLWGIGDASLNTQISALLGTFFAGDTEAAFAQWKIWQSAATAFIFFVSSSTVFMTRLFILLITLPISVLCFSILRITILGKASPSPDQTSNSILAGS